MNSTITFLASLACASAVSYYMLQFYGNIQKLKNKINEIDKKIDDFTTNNK